MKKLEKGESIEYLGCIIENCSNNDGIVLLLPDGSHAGNFGSNVDLAKKCALAHYMMNHKTMRESIASRIVLGEERGKRYGDYSLLLDCLKADGYDAPEAISIDGFNQSIIFQS